MEILRLVVISLLITLLIAIGSGVVYNEKFVVLTGTVVTPVKDDSSLTGITTINFPAGFNKSNCVVISCMAKLSTATKQEFWTVGATKSAIEMTRANYGLTAGLTDDGVKVQIWKVATEQSSQTIDVKVVLMKIN